MATSTVENYVKQLYLLEQRTPQKLIAMGSLAAAMEVTPGTATSMVKTLSDSGLVIYEPRGGTRLSKGGQQLALHVLRRHRLIELLLVEVLGLDWSEVHSEAEALEHAISDKVLERIDNFLNRPSVDPHGDPIPTAKGTIADRHVKTLLDIDTNRPFRIARITDQSAEFLQFLTRRGLTPGVQVTVDSLDAQADAVTLKLDKDPQPITLGTGAARRILVE